MFQVLRNYAEYGNYQGKIERAVTSIRKSFPDRSKEDVTSQLEKCVIAYKEAVILVNENSAYYSSKNDTLLEAEIQFRKKYSGVNDQMLTWIIGFIYHWYHER